MREQWTHLKIPAGTSWTKCSSLNEWRSLGSKAVKLPSMLRSYLLSERVSKTSKYMNPFIPTFNWFAKLTHAWVMIADGKCQVVISLQAPYAKARWSSVWLAVEATVAVCVRAGKGGKAVVAVDCSLSIHFAKPILLILPLQLIHRGQFRCYLNQDYRLRSWTSQLHQWWVRRYLPRLLGCMEPRRSRRRQGLHSCRIRRICHRLW